MKVAVSIPDPLFEAAERISEQLRISRSGLYAQALDFFVKEHQKKSVRENLEAVYSKEPSQIDPMLENLQAEALREDW